MLPRSVSQFICLCLVAGQLALVCSAESLPPKTGKPNILLILTDDLGWRDLSCYGSDFYETPNIDRLASQGMRFTDVYAAATVCSPTRAAVPIGAAFWIGP